MGWSGDDSNCSLFLDSNWPILLVKSDPLSLIITVEESVVNALL